MSKVKRPYDSFIYRYQWAILKQAIFFFLFKQIIHSLPSLKVNYGLSWIFVTEPLKKKLIMI